MNYRTQRVLFQAHHEDFPQAPATPTFHACPLCGGSCPLAETIRRELRYSCEACGVLFGVPAAGKAVAK